LIYDDEKVIAHDGEAAEIEDDQEETPRFGIVPIVLEDVAPIKLDEAIRCAQQIDHACFSGFTLMEGSNGVCVDLISQCPPTEGTTLKENYEQEEERDTGSYFHGVASLFMA
jgi:hypothetical protein